MATINRWHHAVIREPFMQFKTGDEVIVTRCTFKHTSIGPTYWVMHRNDEIIIQVASSAFGTECFKLLRVVKPVPDDKQLKCRERMQHLLRDSVYNPHNRARHMWSDANRPKTINPYKGFEHASQEN